MTLHRVSVARDGNCQVAEAAAPAPRKVPEKLVRCLWFERCWRPATLHTLTGQKIVVHSPGRWNVQAGPDFQHAVIEFADGERRRGDVEIHCAASGWTAHRHHLDARYNRVILHVFLWHDRQAVEVRRADGQAVPQVALSTCLPRPLAAYQADTVLDEYPYKRVPRPGRCYEVLRRLDPPVVRQFLDRAGDVRLQRHMQRWAIRAEEVGLVQVMYEAVMRSLGSTGHRQQFQRLAGLVAWQELQGCLHGVPDTARGAVAEALLLGLAGMLQRARGAVSTMDRDTRHYLKKLQDYWAGFPADIRQRAWCDVSWSQPYVRPASTPERRLAGMAQLLTQYHATDLLQAGLTQCRAFAGRTDTAATRALGKALRGLFDSGSPSYWTWRTRLGSRKGKARRLIGSQRALTVVIDAVLPVLLLVAQDGDAALRASLLAYYSTAPRLPDNFLLRYMARRLLGHDPALLPLLTGARQQQGVLQLFDDYCGNDEGECQGCEFPLGPSGTVGTHVPQG
jgi:hypothetical protein